MEFWCFLVLIVCTGISDLSIQIENSGDKFLDIFLFTGASAFGEGIQAVVWVCHHS